MIGLETQNGKIMNRTFWIGIFALVAFLIVGIGVQYETLETVVNGKWQRGFASFVMLSGRFSFAMFAVALFQQKKWVSGSFGIVASLVIAGMEWKLIGIHTESLEYLVFARGFVLVSMLIEIMLSIYISSLEVEKEVETSKAEPETKVESLVETKVETVKQKVETPTRKPVETSKALAEKIQAAALQMELATGKVNKSQLARELGTSLPTVRKYLSYEISR